MSIFSWEGDIDTLMSPMDSIRYYKHFLGNIKSIYKEKTYLPSQEKIFT